MKKIRKKINNNLKLKCSGLGKATRIIIALFMGFILSFGSLYLIVDAFVDFQEDRINKGLEIKHIRPFQLQGAANDSINYLDHLEYGKDEE